jgi:hypothetical protein
MDVWSNLQVALLNGGLVLLALRAAGLAGSLASTIGAALALTGAGIALLKAWAFPLLARLQLATTRSHATWGV